MLISVTVRQEKTIVGDEFRVVSWVTAADPAGLYPLFVIKEGDDVIDEEWERVADLDDLALYVEHPLTRIDAATPGEFGGVGGQPGDKLIITTSVPEWMDTFVTDLKFEVASIDGSGDFLLVKTDKPFPTTKTGLAWTLKDAPEIITRASGTGAKCYRDESAGAGDTFLRRHWTQLFATVVKASSRVISNEAHIEALVNASKVHGAVFEGIDTETYTE